MKLNNWKFECQTFWIDAIPIISFSYFREIVQQTHKIHRWPNFFEIVQEWKDFW